VTEPRSGDANRSAGVIYSALVITRLTEEDKRGSSLQTRGVAVVTTSGTLVTLLVALSQFRVGGKVLPNLPAASRWLFAIAITAFVAAAFSGLMANLPRALVRPHLSSLVDLIKSEWSAPASAAEKPVALARARQLQELETANDRVARAVFAGLVAEVLAVALAATAVLVALAQG
jgi:hypothetical protein